MPEPKTYGYGRDMNDIEEFNVNNVPGNVTGNAIKFWSKDDHSEEGEAPVDENFVIDEIKVHDMSVYSFYDSEARDGIDEAYHDFDSVARDIVATPSKEDPSLLPVEPNVDPTHPDSN